jgi:hypothetical protein
MNVADAKERDACATAAAVRRRARELDAQQRRRERAPRPRLRKARVGVGVRFSAFSVVFSSLQVKLGPLPSIPQLLACAGPAENPRTRTSLCGEMTDVARPVYHYREPETPE